MKFVWASFLKTILSHIKFRNPNSLQIGMRHQARAIRGIGWVEKKTRFVWFFKENIPYPHNSKIKIVLNGRSETLIFWFLAIEAVWVVTSCLKIFNRLTNNYLLILGPFLWYQVTNWQVVHLMVSHTPAHNNCSSTLEL